MAVYLFRRLLIFIPTLVVITIITFFLSLGAPGDPALQIVTQGSGVLPAGVAGEAADKAYQDLRREMRLDLPVFYFSMTSAATPKGLHKVPKHDRDSLMRQAHTTGRPEAVMQYYFARQILMRENYLLNKTPAVNQDDSRLVSPQTREALAALHGAHEVLQHPRPWLRFLPSFRWYGPDNQYHRWLFGDAGGGGVLRGDFGRSYRDRRPVSSVLAEAIPVTVLMSLSAVLIAWGLAVPVGIHNALNPRRRRSSLVNTMFYMLYALPDFWVATLLILFFAGGGYFHWFPIHGITSLPESAPLFHRLGDLLHHMVLPVFCLSYASLAFIARQTRGGMVRTLRQDYIKSARARGLDHKTVVYRHALRNALLPLITMAAYIFPAVLSGSFVIEYIFSIPGMGFISYNALVARDYPVVFAVLLITAVLTMLGYLISDLLYALADPRIRFHKNR